MKLPHRSVLWVLLAGYWVTLFVLTHLPRPTFMPAVSDKLLHFGAYGGLALLLGAAWTHGRPWRWRQLGWMMVILLVYGAADELLQIPVNRNCDLYDWLADAGGAAAGLAVIGAWRCILGARAEQKRSKGP